MTLRKALLAASMLTMPILAQAQPVTGLYVAAGAGANWMADAGDRLSGPVQFSPGSTLNAGRVEARFSTGYVALASVGWGFGNGLRLEGEGSYRLNEVSRVTVGQPSFIFPQGSFNISGPLGGGRNIGGSVGNFALMANAFYDFNLGWIMPYVGAGIGVAFVDWDGGRATASDGFGSTFGYRLNGNSTRFAYQGMVGAAIPIAAVPGLALTAEYRYFATTNARVNGTFVTPFEGTTRGSMSVPNQHHSLLVGVRYNFGRAPAVMAQDTARPPVNSYLVFFDFDRADLTPRAREILGQAAQASRSQRTTRVEVAGHADRSGTPQYNQGLSQRRANNTAAELVRLGVPRNAISVAAFGESRPLVPTADGVREPQNRRVEIVLR